MHSFAFQRAGQTIFRLLRGKDSRRAWKAPHQDTDRNGNDPPIVHCKTSCRVRRDSEADQCIRMDFDFEGGFSRPFGKGRERCLKPICQTDYGFSTMAQSHVKTKNPSVAVGGRFGPAGDQAVGSVDPEKTSAHGSPLVREGRSKERVGQCWGEVFARDLRGMEAECQANHLPALIRTGHPSASASERGGKNTGVCWIFAGDPRRSKKRCAQLPVSA